MTVHQATNMSTTPDLTTLTAQAALHTESCSASRAARAAWESRYPHFCRECDAAGVIAYRHDPSAAGVSLSPGFMTEEEPCSCVTERRVCPRCGGPWPGPRSYLPRYHLARWLDEGLAQTIYKADRAVREWLTNLLVRAAGPCLARLTRARLRNVIGYGGGALGLSWLAAALSEWLWPGLQDGDSEPACGWCGWNHGCNPDDVRPAHECFCVESEVAAGRRRTAGI